MTNPAARVHELHLYREYDDHGALAGGEFEDGPPHGVAEGLVLGRIVERWTVIESVPKTSVGKFDKKVLRRRYAEGELEVTEI